MEGCGLLDNMLSSKDEFKSYSSVIPADITSKIEICMPKFNGNGDILSPFNIRSQLDQVSQLKTTLTTALGNKATY
jgi:hypothetical protein